MIVSYPYSDTESVKRAVSAARSEHLDDDGGGQGAAQGRGNPTSYIIPDIEYDIVSDIVYRTSIVSDTKLLYFV